MKKLVSLLFLFVVFTANAQTQGSPMPYGPRILNTNEVSLDDFERIPVMYENGQIVDWIHKDSIGGNVDLSDYYTKEETRSEISDSIAGLKSSLYIERFDFDDSNVNQEFELDFVPTQIERVTITNSDIFEDESEYEITGNNLKILSTLKEGDIVRIWYWNGQTNTGSYSKAESDALFYSKTDGDNLEQIVYGIADGTGGKAYPNLDDAMAVTPLPDNGVIFTIDQSNEGERGIYAYDSTETSGFRFVKDVFSEEYVDDAVKSAFTVNMLPEDSRFDENTVVIEDESEKGISAGWFDVRFYEDSDNYIEQQEDGSFKISLSNSGGSNPAFWAVNKLSNDYRGYPLKFSFEIKGDTNSDVTIQANTSIGSGTNINFTTSWRTVSMDFNLGSTYGDNRFGFATTGSRVFYIRNLSLKDLSNNVIEDRINKVEEDLSPLLTSNILPENSRFDENTPITSTTAGSWIRAFSATLSNGTDGSVLVNPAATRQSGVRYNGILLEIPKPTEFTVEFWARKTTEDSLRLIVNAETSGTSAATPYLTDEFVKYKYKITRGTDFDDGRLIIGIFNSSMNFQFEIKNVRVFVEPGEIDKIKDDIEDVSNRVDNISFMGKFFEGKKLSIGGDSISTCSGLNAVEFTVLQSDIDEERTLEAYPTYYDIGTTIGSITVTEEMIGVLTEFSPISGDLGKTIGKAPNYNSLSENQIWWKIVAETLGMEVLSNVSWSGSRVSQHSATPLDNEKTSYLWHDAQINKFKTRDAAGEDVIPDVIILYRGVNDFSKSSYARLTSYSAKDGYPTTDELGGGTFGFKEAYALTIKKLRDKYPNAIIVLCTLNNFKRANKAVFPVNNGLYSLPEMNDAIRQLARDFGCGLIEFDRDGITYENLYPTYINDSADNPTHPNAVGHERMALKAIADLRSQY